MSKKILDEDWLNPKVEIRDIIGKGKGMFALSPILTGEKVLIWGGEYVDKEGADHAKRKGKMVMQWDEDLYSVENEGEDLGYFINHSCNPNVWMIDAFTLAARRDISVDEEITADYALWEDRGNDYTSEWECKCGSPDCRKRITGKDWQLKTLQEKYKDHFSPLINKKIKAQNNENQ